MKRLLAITSLALVLVGCQEPWPYQNDDGNWRYATGPNGEHCLEHLRGNISGMSCDAINWPDDQ